MAGIAHARMPSLCASPANLSGSSGALLGHAQLQPDAAIQEGDVILSVNGVHGDFDAMFAQFAKDSVVFEVERRDS